MGKMIDSMMKECFSGMSEEDKKEMMSRFEKMAAMCPCMKGMDIAEEDKKKMMEKMTSCCGSKMDVLFL